MGKLSRVGFLFLSTAVAAGILVSGQSGVSHHASRSLPDQKPAVPITVDYPLEESIFPLDFTAPTFLWRDPADGVTYWRIHVAFTDGSSGIDVRAHGERLRIGEIDPRCVSKHNKLPALTPMQAAAHTWKPAAAIWETIKEHSVTGAATVTISGYRDGQAVSHGKVTIHTSRDPVGAPIFYRDVPLMPSELQKGVIKPLAPQILPFVAWRLRDVSKPRSRLLMTNLHTCANCHSFSADGKTLGMDLDGPQNDKGLYAIVPIRPHTVIRNKDVISWKSFRGQMEKNKRIGFMSQVSPDGRYVITATQVEYYVANFMDYRFLQVFYPTRGILAWYDRTNGAIHPLPGADDPRYVQSNAVWSPDGSYLVFSRALAKDSYPKGREIATYANDPNEVPIQYDLYRIPFNGGKGGRVEPVPGASRNGMSNSFPKISPDGRWIVFVQCRNGQLMRPDGKLYIIPAAGGHARLMRCNTSRMNSWHSFSPNGRWLVFSSKSRSPYTQMFLTHIDEDGNDSPAILIENATAANRAVNIPEFVNVSPDGFLKIDAPAADFYRLYDLAFDLTKKGRVSEAIAEWNKALLLDPNDANAHNNLGALLLRQGKLDEAATHLRKALEINPELTDALDNLGVVFLNRGKIDEAISHLQKSLAINPNSTETRVNLGGAFLLLGRYKQAAAQLREALRLEPNRLPVLTNLAWILSTCPDSRVRNGAQAVELAERAVKLSNKQDIVVFDTLGAAYAETGRFPEAVEATQKALRLAREQNDTQAAVVLATRITLYQNKKAFRETR